MRRKGERGGGEERSLRIVWHRTAKNLISVLQDFNSAPLLSTTAKLDAIRSKNEAPSLFLLRLRPHFVNLLARSFFSLLLVSFFFAALFLSRVVKFTRKMTKRVSSCVSSARRLSKDSRAAVHWKFPCLCMHYLFFTKITLQFNNVSQFLSGNEGSYLNSIY